MTDKYNIVSVYTLDGARISLLYDGHANFSYLELIGFEYTAFEDVGTSRVLHNEAQGLFTYYAISSEWLSVNSNSLTGQLFCHQLFTEPEDGPIIGYTIEQVKEYCRSRNTGDYPIGWEDLIRTLASCR